jgi:hypothetical protein
MAALAALQKVLRIMGYISLGALALWVIVALGVAIGQAWQHHYHPERDDEPFFEKMEDDGADAGEKPMLLVLVEGKAQESVFALL